MSNKRLYFIVHKPYKVLSQFSDEDGNVGLGSIFDLPKDVYPVGRLDLDTEGLLILTNDKSVNNLLLNPKNQHWRTYLSEVEGVPTREDLKAFQEGFELNFKGKKHTSLPAKIKIAKPIVQDRIPPVNIQKHPVRSWLEIALTEGKNHQVRKMTAKIGHPTLRLIRIGIEDLTLGSLKSGDITQISKNAIYRKLKLL